MSKQSLFRKSTAYLVLWEGTRKGASSIVCHINFGLFLAVNGDFIIATTTKVVYISNIVSSLIFAVGM